MTRLTKPTKGDMRLAMEKAEAQGLHIITDGRDIKVSPIVPPGWRRMAVKVKSQPEVTEGIRCAA